MLRNPGLVLHHTVREILNEVLSLNAQECSFPAGPTRTCISSMKS